MLRNERILITGASGFIGSHLARACVREGAQVACLLRPDTNPWRLLDAASAIKRYDATFTDEASVMSAFHDFTPTIVFNLAANTNRKRDIGLYETLHDTHVRGTLALVRAALGSPSPVRFVHAGTIEEYGRGPVPFLETQREEPITPYSVTKHEGVRIVQYAAKEQGLDAIILRPSLTYGPLQGKTMFIPQFIQAALARKPFNMSTGEQTRDFLYVDDAVNAFLAAGAGNQGRGEIVNVATGVETKLKDVAVQLNALFQNAVEINYGFYPTDPKIETMRCFMNVTRIHETLGWQPSVTLAEGLQRTVDWYMNNAHHYEHLWD